MAPNEAWRSTGRWPTRAGQAQAYNANRARAELQAAMDISQELDDPAADEVRAQLDRLRLA